MKSLRSALGIGALVLSLDACRDNYSPDVNVTYETHDPLFQDIDGDGKADIVYGVEVSSWYPDGPIKRSSRSIVFDVYFKKNLGNGEFAPQKLLLRTEREPRVQILYDGDEDSGKDIWGKPTNIFNDK